MDDIQSWLSLPNTGTIETAGAPWWRLAEKMAPGIKTVVIRREVTDVMDSLSRVGIYGDAVKTRMIQLDHKLDQIEARVPGVLSVRFDDLAHEPTCARVFEHCLPYQHDPAWWQTIAPVNIQVNVAQLLAYADAYAAQLSKMTVAAKSECLASIRST